MVTYNKGGVFYFLAGVSAVSAVWADSLRAADNIDGYSKEAGVGCGGFNRVCRVRIPIGEGGTYKSAVGASLNQCATTCDGSSECAGFEHDHALGRCSFRMSTACGRAIVQGKDCYTKNINSTRIPMVSSIDHSDIDCTALSGVAAGAKALGKGVTKQAFKLTLPGGRKVVVKRVLAKCTDDEKCDRGRVGHYKLLKEAELVKTLMADYPGRALRHLGTCMPSNTARSITDFLSQGTPPPPQSPPNHCVSCRTEDTLGARRCSAGISIVVVSALVTPPAVIRTFAT